MNKLRTTLIKAHRSGQLLETLSSVLPRNRSEWRTPISELAALHNEGLLNVTRAFVGLGSESTSMHDIFRIRRIFEGILPQLEASIQEVVECMLKLYRDPSGRVEAGRIFDAFQEFCSKQRARPQEALAEIEASSGTLVDLLIPALVAGSSLDALFYLDETIRFCQHCNVEFRRCAVFALGKIARKDDVQWTDRILAALDRTVEAETDDLARAHAVRSAFECLRNDASSEPRYVATIASALSRGEDCSLRAASELFGFHTNELPSKLLELLLSLLLQVKPTDEGTLGNIDQGISYLLQSPHADSGILLLENLLLAHPEELTLKTFGSTVDTIIDQPKLLSRVLTRWLFRGVRPLCDELDVLVGSAASGSTELEVDMTEMAGTDPEHFIFIARKAIGYLFLQPISAASFIISLMRCSADDGLISSLQSLLFNPLLVNFSGGLRDYLDQRSTAEEDGCAKMAIGQSLRLLDEYLEGLRSVGDLPALQPSEEHREAYRRHHSQVASEAFQEARADSSLLQLFPVSVLLYGRKAIYYTGGSGGRMEVPLQSFKSIIEVPRMSILDPHGLDYMLRRFRGERMVA